MDLSEALQQLPVRALDELEVKIGYSLTQIFEEDVPKGKVFQGIYWLLKRTEEPEFTWEEAGDATIGVVLQLAEDLLGGDDPDPKEEPKTEPIEKTNLSSV